VNVVLQGASGHEGRKEEFFGFVEKTERRF
jgi:hypothetical protein